MKRVPVRTAVIACGLLLALAACGEAADPGEGSTSPAASSSPSPSVTAAGARTGWIAAIEVAEKPSDLDALTQRLRGPLGRALVVSPTDCLEGLPERAGHGYLIGAAGVSRASAEQLVADAGEKVAFSAKVTIVCTD